MLTGFPSDLDVRRCFVASPVVELNMDLIWADFEARLCGVWSPRPAARIWRMNGS